jgi:glycosyltransferase involved in cell wall biosynthesis
MGRGALTLYLDTVENKEVAEGAGIPFTHANLEEALRRVLDMPEGERNEWRRRAVNRVRERYGWEAVTDRYEALLTRLATKR